MQEIADMAGRGITEFRNGWTLPDLLAGWDERAGIPARHVPARR
jgi:hypothetical protein